MIKQRNTYHQIIAVWPESYASITIERDAKSNVWHTDIYKGKTADDYLRNFRITAFLPGHIPDMLPNNLGWPIVSPRCRDRFLNVDAEVKALAYPINEMLLPKFPAILADYSLLSAPIALDCVDLSSPKIDWFDDTKQLASSFSHLRLIANAIPDGLSFFGLKRIPAVHLISGALRLMLESDRMEGFKFKTCDLI